VQAGWNFRVLLAYGTLLLAGIQLSNVETVMPYIAEQLGSPRLVVSLIVPGFTAGTLLGTALGPRRCTSQAPSPGCWAALHSSRPH
jgi:hypothetical protein